MSYIVSFDIGKKNFAFVIEELAEREYFTNLPKVNKKDRYCKVADEENTKGIPTSEFNKVLETLYKGNKIVAIENHDLTIGTKHNTILEECIFLNMYEVLDKFSQQWDACSIILIEKQMAFGTGKQNTMAMKLAQHCYSYFIYRYRGAKILIDFSATLKTQLLGAPKTFGTITKHYKNGKSAEIADNRKKWSTRMAKQILASRDETKILELFDTKYAKKQDDISDCLLMNQAFCLAHFYNGTSLKK